MCSIWILVKVILQHAPANAFSRSARHSPDSQMLLILDSISLGAGCSRDVEREVLSSRPFLCSKQ